MATLLDRNTQAEIKRPKEVTTARRGGSMQTQHPPSQGGHHLQFSETCVWISSRMPSRSIFQCNAKPRSIRRCTLHLSYPIELVLCPLVSCARRWGGCGGPSLYCPLTVSSLLHCAACHPCLRRNHELQSIHRRHWHHRSPCRNPHQGTYRRCPSPCQGPCRRCQGV